MLVYIKFGNGSQNCQTAKLKSLPNELHIWYTVFTSDMRHRDSLYCMAITSVYTIDNYITMQQKALTNRNFDKS